MNGASTGTLYVTDNNGLITQGMITLGQQSQAISWQGGTGIAGTYSTQTRVEDGKVKRISPKLYFSYVKSKLNKTQTKKLKARLQKLQSLVKSADENGQTALYEQFSKMLFIAVRESEAAACGYDVFVDHKDINKFINIVTEHDKTYNNPVKFSTLENFPRPIPAKIAKIVKSVQTKKLFDELHVLYLDYTNEKIKSTKEKIREKDPIIFGRFSYDPSRYFFIADWIDEHCDLTLSTFVDKLKADDKEYETKQIEEITPEYLERIKTEIKDREKRLFDTNPGNYREKIAEEKFAKELKELKEENAKLRDEKTFLDEDKEIAIEKALRDRDQWRKEASIDPLPKKPWYRRWF